jgi:ParB family transcriptional regulator, chromosome partitioning protein
MSTSGAGNRRGGLGRGLGSLIPTTAPDAPGNAPLPVDIDRITPNPFQPRSVLDQSKLQVLADSIRQHGIIQPLVVRAASNDRYVLIAGERRWRAAQLAGLESVPVVVMDAAPRAQLELALVENVVRSDLSPLEEAAAYRQLIEEFGLTQTEVAERVGCSRVSVTNTLRLLTSPEAVQSALNAGQVAMLEAIVLRGWSVRQTEEAVRKWVSDPAPVEPEMAPARDLDAVRLEDRFRSALGTRVSLKRTEAGGAGSITIHFHSDEELQGLYERIIGEDLW